MIGRHKADHVIAAASALLVLFTLSPSAAVAQTPDLGIGASLHGKQVFPGSNAWNQDISQMPVDPNSTSLLTSIGLATGLHADFGAPYNGVPNGIPYIVVPGSQAGVPVNFQDPEESDPGPYPIPSNAPIEGGPNGTGDRHVLVVDRDHWLLYELFYATPAPDFSSWSAGSGALFNFNSNAPRPQGWTSADAAGLPIFPGLVRYDEVFEQRAINHALRFTVQRSRHAFVYPARHFASSLTASNLPPMGMRVRLKASFDISKYPASVQVILTAMKKYGMIVADNGSNWFVSGAPDNRWNDTDLHTLTQVHGSDFEVVQMGPVTTNSVAAPANLRATAGAGSVSLSWSSSAAATSYIVKRATSVAGPFTNIAANVTQTSGTDTAVTSGVTYYYVVSAVQADMQSYDSSAAFATPGGTPSSSSAAFVKSDSSTQGSWKGVYGADGYNVIGNAASLPAYATGTISGNAAWTWASSSSDLRALQKATSSTDRIAACWYSGNSFTYDLNLTDGQVHQVAFYCLDWDNTTRSQTIQIFDAANNTLLDSQSVSAFTAGKYLVWSIKGHVQVRVTNTGSPNAVVSGVFFR